MKYKYEFYKDHLDSLRIKLPDQLDIFSHFIELIATEDLANEVIESINLVQSGKLKHDEIMINAPTVLIKSGITSVSLSDILDDSPPDQCIETDELRKLILIWKKKLPERFIDRGTQH